MDIEDLVSAQEGILNTTSSAVCPCCQQSGWRGLPALDHLLTTGVVAIDSDGVDHVSEDAVEDLFQMGFRHQPLVGIFCTSCGFVRFHVPLPDGI